jgi:predicted extracellular nuclease
MKSEFLGSSAIAGRVALSLLVISLAACGGGDSIAPVGEVPAGEVPVVVQPPVVATLPACASVITATAPLTAISAVQGSGNLSPLAAQNVTVRGVVVGEFQNTGTTSTRLNGFFVQQAVPDADPLTSEGIFVFAPDNATRVKAGDFVQVSGLVAEFGQSSGASAAPDSITQITGTTTAPVVISVCGGAVALAATQVTLPAANSSALERYEGMLVEFSQTLAVTELFELGRFGQMALALNGRQFHPNNGNVVVTNAQNLLARIVLDDGSSKQNPNPIPYLSALDATGTRRMGDQVQKVTGVLNHNFGTYRVHPTVAPAFANVNLRQATAPVVNGSLKVASFNVLNYFTTFTNGQTASGQTGQGCTLGSASVTSSNCRGANNLNEFERQQAKIVAAIAGLDADVVGLMEIQNTDVATNNLVAALNARMGAGTYAAVNSGTFGTDAIKVDILYKPAKVQRVGGVQLPTGADLANYTAPSNRPPLAQRFASAGNNGGFWFVVNHFKSKGSCPSSGDVDLGQGCFNTGRTQQATALNSFVDKLKAQGEQDVLMMGDFNSYLLEDPTKVLETAGHESLLKRMPANDRFTYVFGGETGALDHAYASSSLRQQVSGVSVWHINADEPSVLDYNTDFNTDDRFAPTPFRASDHDPVLVGLSLAPDAAVSLPLLSATIPASAQAAQPFSVTITEASAGANATITSVSVDWGDGTAAASVPGAGSVAHTYASPGTFSVVLTLANSAGQTATQAGAVTVAAVPVTPPVTPSGTRELFFSEYIEGGASNKALEIYNPTAAAVDLSAYTVKLFSNGASTTTFVLPLSGSLAPGQMLVLVNSKATAPFQVAGSVTADTVVNFNGDDALTLEKSGTVIDRIGQLGVDPGTEWSSNGVNTQNRTLRRKPAFTSGDNNAAAVFDPSLQWDGFAQDTSDGLGAHAVN